MVGAGGPRPGPSCLLLIHQQCVRIPASRWGKGGLRDVSVVTLS